jgi:hypothetical protein
VEPKQIKFIDAKNRIVVASLGVWWKWGTLGESFQTFIYKIN